MRPYLELLRPGNVATALADVLAGVAVTGLAHPAALPWLLASTVWLYGGGVVLNDVFDRHIDARERPERPLPSGRASVRRAAWLGAVLLVAGIGFASRVSDTAAAVAALIALSVLCYDAWGKRQMFIGPVNMGLCRGLNLVLGMASAPETIRHSWWLGLIAVTYIAAVTMVSRGEVAGGKRPVALAATGLVGAALAALAWVTARQAGWQTVAWLYLAVLAWRVLPPFLRTAGDPSPMTIRVAVRTGVLSLVLVNAVIAAAYAGMIYSLAVVATALLAGWLARRFAVT